VAEAAAKEKSAPPKGKGGGAIQDNIDLPEKFKEEERLFHGTADVIKEERERGVVGKMVSMALHGSLKITLDHMDAMIKQNSISEGALDQHLRHYLKKDENMAVRHLKVIAEMLIEQARGRGVSLGIQVVILFKAIDCLRMAIQYTSGADNIPCFMILQIMSKMPAAFVPHMNREKEIFNLSIALQRALKEELPTVNIRNKLASLYTKQHCYADALYQYEHMLVYFSKKKPPTPADKEKICVINISMADMYKDIYSFSGDFKNGQILQNFVFRNNRDADIGVPGRHHVKEITGPVNKMTVKDLYKDLQQSAVLHYETALKFFPKNKNRKRRSEILVIVGKNYADMGKFVDGAERLQDSQLLLGKERNSPEIFKGKEDVLELIRNCIAKIPAGPKKEKFKSFVIKEENTLDADKAEWEENEKKKDEIKKKAEGGGRRKKL